MRFSILTTKEEAIEFVLRLARRFGLNPSATSDLPAPNYAKEITRDLKDAARTATSDLRRFLLKSTPAHVDEVAKSRDRLERVMQQAENFRTSAKYLLRIVHDACCCMDGNWHDLVQDASQADSAAGRGGGKASLQGQPRLAR